MPKLKFRIVISLEILSAMFMMAGLVLLLTSCGTFKKSTVKTNKTHIETNDSDTTYKAGTVKVDIKGSEANNQGGSGNLRVKDSTVFKYEVRYRDSLVYKDSTVYRYRYLPSSDYIINYDPVFAFNPYGYAKGWVLNNTLFVELKIYDRVFQAKVDSAAMVINNRHRVETSSVVESDKSLTRSWFNASLILGLILGMLFVISIWIIVKKFRGNWLRFIGKQSL